MTDERVMRRLEVAPRSSRMMIAVDGVRCLLHLLQALALVKHEEERGCLV